LHEDDDDDRVVLLTPDEDHYEVEPSREHAMAYILGPRRGLPSHGRKSIGLIYWFDQAYPDEELAWIFAEAQRIAEEKGL
jgi:hypothetical protein